LRYFDFGLSLSLSKEGTPIEDASEERTMEQNRNMRQKNGAYYNVNCFRGLIPFKGKIYFSTSGTYSVSCLIETGCSFPGGKAARGVKLTSHFHLVPVKNVGAIPCNRSNIRIFLICTVITSLMMV
jgi:hypothetical protein